MRPSRDEVLMEHAWVTSRRSTCARLGVGAVIALNGRILTQGYNGAPAGLPHCDHTCDCTDMGLSSPIHETWCNSRKPCLQAEHAERNAIAFAARHGVALEGAELFVTHMPCLPCAMSVINAGVIRVVYDRTYRLDDGVKLLQQAGIVVDMIKPKR